VMLLYQQLTNVCYDGLVVRGRLISSSHLCMKPWWCECIFRRSNLDPFGRHIDRDLWTALEKCHIKGMVSIDSSFTV